MQTPEGIVTGRYEDSKLIADDGEYVPGRDGVLTYPCSPSALYCVGRNFTETLDQMEYERPEEPDFFYQAASIAYRTRTTGSVPRLDGQAHVCR